MEIKPLEKNHIQELTLWQQTQNVKEHIAIVDWDKYFEYAANNLNTFLYGIYSPNFVGQLTLEIDTNPDIVSISIIINPKFQNRGYGQKALKKL